MNTKNTILTALFIVLFFFLGGRAYAQEATEDGSETTTTEEGNSTATEGLESNTTPSSITPDTVITPPRVVSQEDLGELEAAQSNLNRADAVVQYILTRIITDYGINVQAEMLNIKTGLITPRPGVAYTVTETPDITTTTQ